MAPSRKRSRRLLGAALAIPMTKAFAFTPRLDFAPPTASTLDVREMGTHLLLEQVATHFTREGRALTKMVDENSPKRPFSLNHEEISSITRHFDHFAHKDTFVAAVDVLRRAGTTSTQAQTALSAARRIAEATQDVNMSVASLLHEALGSGRLGIQTLEPLFGTKITELTENCAAMVALHADARDLVWSDEGLMRLKADQAENMQNMIITASADWRVVALVLAHHTQLLEAAASETMVATAAQPAPAGRQTYVLAREALDVYAPLAHRLGMHALKNELEDLGFKTLYPVEYKELVRELESRAETQRAVLESTLAELKRAVQDDLEFMNAISHVSFEARAKQPYSVWRKLLRLNQEEQRAEAGAPGLATLSDHTDAKKLDGIFDHLAMRVVFEPSPMGLDESAESLKAQGEALCYHLRDLVKSEWKAMEFRDKDYVANPKANGYQSLHATATVRYHGRSVPFEVQIRTREMHQVAEWGKAAHASYKADLWECLSGDCRSHEPATATAEDKIAMAKANQRRADAAFPLSLLSRRSSANEESTPPASFRSGGEYSRWLREDLTSRRVFVILRTSAEDGAAIWDLDKGMSIKDALWRHRSLPFSGLEEAVSKIRVNGDRVALDYKLRNGDAILM